MLLIEVDILQFCLKATAFFVCGCGCGWTCAFVRAICLRVIFPWRKPFGLRDIATHTNTHCAILTSYLPDHSLPAGESVHHPFYPHHNISFLCHTFADENPTPQMGIFFLPYLPVFCCFVIHSIFAVALYVFFHLVPQTASNKLCVLVA